MRLCGDACLPASRSLIPSFCLFSLPFLLPLLNAASRRRLAKQNHCALQYRRPIADVEGIGELKLVSHCSLVTIHYSLFTAKPSPFGKPKSLCATIPPTNCRCRRNPGVEIGFITHHSSFFLPAPRVAIEPRGVTFKCPLLFYSCLLVQLPSAAPSAPLR